MELPTSILLEMGSVEVSAATGQSVKSPMPTLIKERIQRNGIPSHHASSYGIVFVAATRKPQEPLPW